MNGNSYVLDANIISLFLKGDRKLLPYFNYTIIHISFITELELKSIPGLSTAEERKILTFLNTCIITDINTLIKETAVAFRNNFKMQLPNAIIAATASYLGYTLITADKGLRNYLCPLLYIQNNANRLFGYRFRYCRFNLCIKSCRSKTRQKYNGYNKGSV